MLAAVAGLVLLVLLAGLAVLIAVGWTAARGAAGSARPRLSARDRVWQARAIEGARWVAAHDEVAGLTRVLLRRTFIGLDGRPEVLEERLLDSFPAQDPAWEPRFTEAMSAARFRCSYLNAEERPG